MAPARGPADKVTLIEVTLRPFGEIVAKAEDEDNYKSLTTATARVKEALSRHADKIAQGSRRAKPDSRSLGATD